MQVPRLGDFRGYVGDHRVGPPEGLGVEFARRERPDAGGPSVRDS